MIRARLPRRIRAAIPALAAGLALTASPAAATQDPHADPRAMTILGNDANARRCGQNVAGGDSSDATIAACTRALEYRRLTREAQVQLLVNRGVTHLRRQQNELAVADFDAVIVIDGENAEAHLNRGAALVQLRRYGPAIASLTEALGLGVQEPHKAYFNRGIAREALGDLRGAFEDYTTALQIEPDWGPASAELARFARARREHLATVLDEPTTP
ncbi:MAG TPA: tetratricopeptide repeat protein [Vitreimonas sp.]|uniref:tetratricopeptide repeat protein n=1 Tax=Vitreimonas sp. TaxID=3069702 RepID=UPI002D31DBFF|nr:tetratricopeptide repeat protein [Vitreimonas sp.]HYD87276.1 tetratricopeptide repeat protein [Vitreimonas sp.]